jgi:uncharacterized protein
VAIYFFDSSAVVKRYVNETGTAWVKNTTNPQAGNRIHLARITAVEVVSALVRRTRGGGLSPGAAATAIAEFRNHLSQEYVSTDVTSVVVASAMRLAEAHALRGYDAVQLAVALEVNRRSVAVGIPGLTLISSDADLNAAAIAEGLTTDDPNNNP